MSILLNGIEQYDQTLKGPNAIKDTVPNRARATLIYSAVFYLTLLWEGFIVYYYFRPLGTYLKTKVQTQLTTLLLRGSRPGIDTDAIKKRRIQEYTSDHADLANLHADGAMPASATIEPRCVISSSDQR